MSEQPKDWQCQECGKRMTLRQAEQGCPKCGGMDIECAPMFQPEKDLMWKKIEPILSKLAEQNGLAW